MPLVAQAGRVRDRNVCMGGRDGETQTDRQTDGRGRQIIIHDCAY